MPWCRALVMLAVVLGLAACAQRGGPAPVKSPLQTVMVACQIELAAPPAKPGPATDKSAYDCVKSGGDYVSINPAADLNLWLEAAKSDDPVAQTHAGDLYASAAGGRSPDYATAASWYRRAVKQDHAPAMLRFAALLDQGLGVPRDPDYARDLRRRASRHRAEPRDPPRFFLVDPPLLLSGVASGVPVTVPVDRPEGWINVIGRVVGSDGRVRSVMVNEQPRKVDGDGYFQANIELRREGTPLTLRAEDAAGQLTEVALSLQPGKRPVRAAGTAAAPEGQRHALLIANQDYRFHDKLETPLNDARDLKQLLERRFGYRTTVLANATRRDVLAALAELRRKLTPEDSLIVFYAGHGELDTASDRGYWIPVDARPGDSTGWLSTIDVSDQLRAIEARQVLLIVDSCYAGVLNRRAQSRADAELVVRSKAGPSRGVAARTRVAMTSGGLEPVVDGVGGRNSLYAASLLQVLEAMAAPLDAGDLHREVVARFRWRAGKLGLDQRPRFAPMQIAGHEAGEFRLAPLP